MRNISEENLAALEARQLVARDFLWFVARDRATGAPVTDGMWSDVGNVSAAIVHPDTGLPVTRDWYGSGTLVQIDDIPLVANLSVQNVNSLLAQSLAGHPKDQTFSVNGTLQGGGDVPRSFILGRIATAGSLVFVNTWGQDGDTPNAYLTQVIALSDLPVRGLAEVWVNGEFVTFGGLTDRG